MFMFQTQKYKPKLLPKLTPRELAVEIPPKMLVGRRDCLHKKCFQFLEAGRIAYILCRRSCLPTQMLRRQSYLPTNGGISAACSQGVKVYVHDVVRVQWSHCGITKPKPKI